MWALAVCVLAAPPAPAQRAADGGFTLSRFEIEPELLSGKRYSEGWDQHFAFDDGSLLSTHFIITNLGIGDHRGLVIGTLIRPDGNTLTIKNGRARKDWSFSSDRLDLRLASHQLSVADGRYRLFLKNASGEIEVAFDALAPPWRMGRTWEDHDEEAYQRLTAYAPAATATGRFRLGPRSGADPENEPWTSLGEGRGFGLRYVNSVALAGIAKDWVRVFPLRGKPGPAPALSALWDADRGHRAQFALIDGHGGLLQEADDVSVEYASLENISHQGQIYAVPDKLRVTGRGPGFSFSGTIASERFLQTFDLVEELKPVERFFVRFTKTPVHFRFLADYEIDLTAGQDTSRLIGTALMEVLSFNSRSAD